MLRQQVKNYLIELKMIGSSAHTLSNYGFHLDKFVSYIESRSLDFTTLEPAITSSGGPANAAWQPGLTSTPTGDATPPVRSYCKKGYP
ncbi:hypothetical protein SPSYN_00106 [Sporotomaculum syntrophicum]|uniref:Uncharacterized protein n=1 Tax=Sporotomaculum syntrophicum TaxID=182264 RepID=A0A9D2WSP5_9FIRM|nr:hypothetical protein SPSYN_00106 [Sporotomaculum syntrophicum]